MPEGLIVYTEDKEGNRTEEKCDGENDIAVFPWLFWLMKAAPVHRRFLQELCRIMESEPLWALLHMEKG